MNATLDFGYPWWLYNGHFLVALFAAVLAWKGPRAKWARLLAGTVCLWAFTCFLLVRFGVNIDSVASLPAKNFLASGQGRVLDLGAGTGRSTIMLLKARPQATAVALDLFGASFDQHFGAAADPRERLAANLRAAQVADRVSIVTADMRKIPFADSSFDAIVSAFAVDHLNREGVDRTLAESARVLKPGGEFLLQVVNGRDPWARFAFGPLLAHGGFRGADWWRGRLEAVGFQLVEEGRDPPSFYFLLRRPT